MEGNEVASPTLPYGDNGSGSIQSPETYLGYGRAKNFSSPEAVAEDETAIYTYPDPLLLNNWALNGAWEIADEFITSRAAGAALRYNFIGGRVFLVLASEKDVPIHAKITLNGKAPGERAGKDVSNGLVMVKQATLYELIKQPEAENGVLEIIADAPGLRAYAFTFGAP